MSTEDTTLAQAAYAAYGHATGGRNFLGQPMPAWDDLPDTIREAWGVAASTVQAAAVPLAQNELGILRKQIGRLHDLTELLRLRRDPMAGRALADLIDRWLLEAITDEAPLPNAVETSMTRLATEIIDGGHQLADRMAEDDNAGSYANDLRTLLFPWTAIADRAADHG